MILRNIIRIAMMTVIGLSSCNFNKTKTADQQADSIISNESVKQDLSVYRPTKAKSGSATVFTFAGSANDIKVISDEKAGAFFIETDGKKIPLKDEEKESFTCIEDCRMCNSKVWMIATRSLAGMTNSIMRNTSVFYYDTTQKAFKNVVYCGEAKFNENNVECQDLYIKNPDVECEADFDFASVTTTIGIDGMKKDASDKEIIRFITEMYDGELYNNNDFLEKYCTKALLKQLKAKNEYDDDGYAGWLFRSKVQDGPSDKHSIIKVTPIGNSWYKYSFYDMGNKCTNKVKVIVDGHDIKFDQIVAI